MILSISIPAFSDGEVIPSKYTCEGKNISPQLHWAGIPEEAKSLALIVDNPDAPGGTFTHWVIFNIPPGSNVLSQDLSLSPKLFDGSIQGGNDYGEIGYSGPCPPPGKPHRYCFSLYALDKQLSLAAGSFKHQVLDAIESHILAQGQLIDIYQR